MQSKFAVQLVKETASEWSKDKAPRLAAALAYYTLFSLAPILVIAVAVAGFFFDESSARDTIVSGLGQVLGPSGQKGVTEMVANASNREKSGLIATIIGFLTLLVGASGVFGQLKDALNTIWDVPEKKGGGVVGMIRDRFLSFTMVLGVGFLLLVSLVLTAILSALGDRIIGGLPGSEVIWQTLNFVVSFAVITVLFAALFKYLPDKKIEWRDVWVGAFFTAALFTLGKFAIGLYLGKGTVGNTFGAAASLAILLVWLYYAGMIFFFGAEFTEVYSRAHRATRAGENVWKPRERSVVDALAAAPAIAHTTGQRPSLEKAARSTTKASAPSKSGTGAVKLAGAGAAGIFLGALATSIGAVVTVLKGVKKVVRLGH